jgi:hypothetical protein
MPDGITAAAFRASSCRYPIIQLGTVLQRDLNPL